MNNYEDFEKFCMSKGVTLYEGQKEYAKMLFNMPKHELVLPAGKSTLIALLACYDSVFESYYSTIKNLELKEE